LLNDVIRVLIEASQSTNNSIQIRKMLRDALGDILLLGHWLLELRNE
jgi:hypothetical protein